MKWFGSQATCRATGAGFMANMSAGNNVGTTGKTITMINKTNIATATGDNRATSKANYKEIYYRYLALFNDCWRHADFVRVG